MAVDARAQLAQDLLGCAYNALTPVQRSVIDLIAAEAPTGVDSRLLHDERTRGERIADKVAAVGGSWGFIIGFGLVLAVWIGWNVLSRGVHLAFDPYPFIFLNLMLSMLAAIQAPIIMMSQNRSAARDRLNAEQDYVVNLRAELEIMHLHDKIDAMRKRELLGIIKRQNEALRTIRETYGTPKRGAGELGALTPPAG